MSIAFYGRQWTREYMTWCYNTLVISWVPSTTTAVASSASPLWIQSFYNGVIFCSLLEVPFAPQINQIVQQKWFSGQQQQISDCWLVRSRIVQSCISNGVMKRELTETTAFLQVLICIKDEPQGAKFSDPYRIKDVRTWYAWLISPHTTALVPMHKRTTPQMFAYISKHILSSGFRRIHLARDKFDNTPAKTQYAFDVTVPRLSTVLTGKHKIERTPGRRDPWR